MLICPKCQSSNALGRVFCSSCGSKLDLKELSMESMPQSSRGVSGATVLRVIIQVVVVLLVVGVICTVLALIPQTAPLGEEGSRAAAAAFKTPLRALKQVPRGQTLGRSFSESDINGYLGEVKAKQLGYQAVSVDVGEGYFTVRLLRPLGPFSFAGLTFESSISTDLACVPQGGYIHVRKAKSGLLPLVGPFKTAAVRGLYRRLAADRDWESFEHVNEIRAENGVIYVEVKR